MTAIMASAWLDALQSKHNQVEKAKHSRKRRADIRAALTEAQVAERTQYIESQIRDLDADAEMAVIDAERLGHDDTENCVHCSALSRASQLRTFAARWAQILTGDYEPRPYSPQPRMTWCPDTQEWALVDDEDRLPEFEDIDVAALRPEVADRLIRIVSDARNWIWEPAGVEEITVTHRGFLGGTPKIVVNKPKVKRTYPGCHWITPERQRDKDGHLVEAFARTAIITIWSDRKGWCVYHCEQGPKRGKFGTWVPVSYWHDSTWARSQPENGSVPVQVTVTDEFYESYISEDVDRLERALEVAYLKAAEVRAWVGEMAPFESPLPFSPALIETIGDAQANELERQRHTSEPADD